MVTIGRVLLAWLLVCFCNWLCFGCFIMLCFWLVSFSLPYYGSVFLWFVACCLPPYGSVLWLVVFSYLVMGQFMEQRRTWMPSYDAAFNRTMDGDFAFIADRPILDYVARKKSIVENSRLPEGNSALYHWRKLEIRILHSRFSIECRK